jgi:hypothetical protein
MSVFETIGVRDGQPLLFEKHAHLLATSAKELLGADVELAIPTLDPGDRPLQYITNGGAFSITAPANDGSLVLLVTNNSSAAAITFSGFTVGSNVGDALTTTNTSKFVIYIYRANSVAWYSIQALQ